MAENVTRVDRGDYTFAECEEYLVIETGDTGINNGKEQQTPEKSQPQKATPSPTHAAAAPPKKMQERSSRKRIACEDTSDTECSRKKKHSRTFDAHQQASDCSILLALLKLFYHHDVVHVVI